MIMAAGVVLCVLLIGAGGVFAGSETGMYRVSRLRLRVDLQQGRSGVRWLVRAMRDPHGLMLSLLTGNNLTNYLVTSVVTWMLLRVVAERHTAELTATAILTPVLFLFVDIVPKTLFYHRANVLLPVFGPLLWLFHVVFVYSGIVPFLKGVTAVLHRLTGFAGDAAGALAAGAGHPVGELIRETREEGVLSPLQRRILQRLIAAPTIQVRRVMVPLRQVEAVEVNTDRAGLVAALAGSRHGRLCVYEGRRERIIGYVDAPAVLAGGEAFGDLRGYVRRLRSVEATCSVLEALVQMRTRGERMLAVVVPSRAAGARVVDAAGADGADDMAAGPDATGPVVGLVTLADLLEELTGQIHS